MVTVPVKLLSSFHIIITEVAWYFSNDDVIATLKCAHFDGFS